MHVDRAGGSAWESDDLGDLEGRSPCRGNVEERSCNHRRTSYAGSACNKSLRVAAEKEVVALQAKGVGVVKPETNVKPEPRLALAVRAAAKQGARSRLIQRARDRVRDGTAGHQRRDAHVFGPPVQIFSADPELARRTAGAAVTAI